MTHMTDQIFGLFVSCKRVIKGSILNDTFLIKIIDIHRLRCEVIDDVSYTIFNAKDENYATTVDVIVLINVINNHYDKGCHDC